MPGIDLPELSAASLRENLVQAAESLSGSRRIMVFGCRDERSWRRARRRLDDDQTAVVDTICVGQLPPPYIDFVLSRGLADGAAYVFEMPIEWIRRGGCAAAQSPGRGR